MKDSLTSLDMHYLAQELQMLEKARIDKTYQGEDEHKHDFTFVFRKAGTGKVFFRLVLPGLACIVDEKPTYGRLPGHFAVFLRKHLGNATLNTIRQRDFERILELEFENKKGTFTLLIELLSPGNALLLNDQGKIINLMQPQRHGQRLLRGGAIYTLPPEMFNTKTATADQIADRLLASQMDSLVKAIAIDLSFGGPYAEEVCKRAGVDKDAKPKKKDINEIAKVVKKMFKEKVKAFSVGKEIFPISLKTKKKEKEFDSFSAAIETVIPVIDSEAVPVSKGKSKKDKVKDMLDTQERMLSGYKKSAKENHAKGERIYERYQDVDNLLKAINKDRKQMDWKEVKEKYKEQVTKINENKGEIVIEL